MVKVKKKNNFPKILGILIGIIVAGGSIYAGIVYVKHVSWDTPEELLTAYMAYIPEAEYEKMYEMLNVEASGNIAREDFIKRNSAIYEKAYHEISHMNRRLFLNSRIEENEASLFLILKACHFRDRKKPWP